MRSASQPKMSQVPSEWPSRLPLYSSHLKGRDTFNFCSSALTPIAYTLLQHATASFKSLVMTSQACRPDSLLQKKDNALQQLLRLSEELLARTHNAREERIDDIRHLRGNVQRNQAEVGRLLAEIGQIRRMVDLVESLQYACILGHRMPVLIYLVQSDCRRRKRYMGQCLRGSRDVRRFAQRASPRVAGSSLRFCRTL